MFGYIAIKRCCANKLYSQVILPDIEVGTKINALRLKLNLKKTFIVENKEQLLKKIDFIKKNKNKLNKIKNKSTKFFEMINKRNVQIFY